MISFLVNTIERKDYIEWRSLKKVDIITSQIDTLSFKTQKYGTRNWKPIVGDDIVVWSGAEKIFGGEVVKVKERIEGGKLITCDVSCKDYTHEMDKKLVFDTYEDTTVEDIIDDIITTYCPGFTITNVATTGITLKYILFNYKEPSKCLQELAELIGYDWYVDYDRDIHFFSKLTGETAGFNLTDTNENYIFDSLKVSEDDTQLRNTVYVRGGEYVGVSRADKVGAGDGTTKSFKVPYRYDSKPTVTVGGGNQTVGIDYIDSEDDYNCLWNYQEKVIKFKTAPASGDVVVTGEPMIPVLIKAKRASSINVYGEYEYVVVDKTIKTKEAARQRADAEFQDYALPIKDASFATYKDGLRSGQKINIQSDIRTINQDYIITKITMRMRTPIDKFLYEIELSTGRPLGIIDFLQKQIDEENKKVGIFKQEGEVLDIIVDIENIDTITISELLKVNDPTYIINIKDIDTVTIADLLIRAIKDSPPIWVYGSYFPVNDADRNRPAFCDRGCYLAT